MNVGLAAVSLRKMMSAVQAVTNDSAPLSLPVPVSHYSGWQARLSAKNYIILFLSSQVSICVNFEKHSLGGV